MSYPFESRLTSYSVLNKCPDCFVAPFVPAEQAVHAYKGPFACRRCGSGFERIEHEGVRRTTEPMPMDILGIPYPANVPLPSASVLLAAPDATAVLTRPAPPTVTEVRASSPGTPSPVKAALTVGLGLALANHLTDGEPAVTAACAIAGIGVWLGWALRR